MGFSSGGCWQQLHGSFTPSHACGCAAIILRRFLCQGAIGADLRQAERGDALRYFSALKDRTAPQDADERKGNVSSI